MIRDKALFWKLDESIGGSVGCANKSMSSIRGQGSIRFNVSDSNGQWLTMELSDAYWVPSYAHNLISVAKLRSKGISVDLNDPGLTLPDGTHLPLLIQDGLYKLQGFPIQHQGMASRTISQWHVALGHNNLGDIKRLSNAVEGMSITGGSSMDQCDTCSMEKAKRTPISKDVGTRAQS